MNYLRHGMSSDWFVVDGCFGQPEGNAEEWQKIIAAVRAKTPCACRASRRLAVDVMSHGFSLSSSRNSTGEEDVVFFPWAEADEWVKAAEALLSPHKSTEPPPVPTLRRVQTELKEWQAHNFPGRTSINPLLGTAEEIGEMCGKLLCLMVAAGKINHHYLKRMQGIRLNEDHNAGLRDGVADLLIFLCDFCNAENIDLEKELVETWAKVRQRDWKKCAVTGGEQK